jgi:hypothetical protein
MVDKVPPVKDNDKLYLVFIFINIVSLKVYRSLMLVEISFEAFMAAYEKPLENSPAVLPFPKITRSRWP